MFTREFGEKFTLRNLLSMAITFLPYQWMLGISAIRGVWRELRKKNNWEKTAHHGAHRHTEPLLVQENEKELQPIGHVAHTP